MYLNYLIDLKKLINLNRFNKFGFVEEDALLLEKMD